MAKIKDSKPKGTSRGYHRLFGNDELGDLMSKVQSAVIRSGIEARRENMLAGDGSTVT